MEYQAFFFFQFLVTLFSIFVVFTTWKTSKTTRPTNKLPPGPWRLPIMGNMHLLIGSLPHRRLRDLSNKYGLVMHLQLGEVSTVVVSSPETAKEVMKTQDAAFAHRPFIVGPSIIFYNCSDIGFSPYGDYWRQLRKICVLELLSAKRVRSFRPIREEEVGSLIKTISSHTKPVNLSEMLLSLSNKITSRAAFGELCKQQQDAFIPLIQKCMEAIGGFTIADVFPSIKLLHVISGMPKVKRLHQQLDVILENIIDEHRAAAKVTETEDDDLVHVLLNLQGNGSLKIPLTMDGLKAVVLDMFLAGSETSSTLMEWAMSEMLKNPRVMKKTQAEVRQVYSNKEYVDETSLNELTYLNLVIKETLRLHPPGPLLLPRESQERTEINGYEIPAKTKVIVNGWAIGRDPHYWSEAERFYPERFVEGSIDYKGKNFEYIPFGAGRRMCPGMLKGMAVAELALANLLYHFDWQLPGGTKFEDLDMSEVFGAVVSRRNDLYLIPIPYHDSSVQFYT